MKFIKTWLPILFGCHCRDDRSFYFRQTKFPICARCTGELIGMIIGIPLFFIIRFNIIIYILLSIPLVIDGTIQLLTSYESNNIKRLITGILFGISLISIVMYLCLIGNTLGVKVANRFIYR